jgi:multidrug efflux system membrane fusion protein
VRGFWAAATSIILAFAAAIPARAEAPTPVPTATLQPTSWRATIQLSAAIDAEQQADLAAERSGRVVSVLYNSGAVVPAGAPLVQLDNGPEAAQLQVDQAKLTESTRALAREQKLMTIAGASQAALEQAQADAAEAKAQVSYDNAALAQLTITAPFAGTLGIRKISAGDYVTAGQVVATITQSAPLRVLFSIPQTEAAGIAVGAAFSIAAPAAPGMVVSATGHITALSPQVDATTNARDAEGEITDNATEFLPGMNGTVTLQTGAAQPAFTVPATALNDSVLGRFLFLLRPAGGAYRLTTVYVTEYGQAGNNAVIATTGLQAGDIVVATGGFKLADGTSVTPSN